MPSRQEPINEWLASEVCSTLDMDYCKYDIDIIDNKIVSKCDNFVGSSEELIMAYNIINSEGMPNYINDFTHYINILKKHGIANAREKLVQGFKYRIDKLCRMQK